MRRFSNTFARPENEKETNDFMAQALAELQPRWKTYKTMEPYQLAWEFLRRNILYIAYSNRLQKKWENTNGFWERVNFCNLYANDPTFICFGLSEWLRPEDEISCPLCWSENLNPKYMARARIECGLDKKSKILYLPLKENEDVLILKRDLPYKLYLRQLQEFFKEQEKENIPQIAVEKLRQYLMVYDLRTWGKQHVSKKQDSCISWHDIALFLSPDNPPSVQMVKKQFYAAHEMIYVRYRLLVKYYT